MNDIDFIKWMCDKADDFTWVDPRIVHKDYGDVHVDFCGTEALYPLLLQRAIEGLNRSNGKFLITQWPETIDIVKNDSHCDPVYNSETIKDFDKAKESALKYIYEHEVTEPLNA